MTLDTVCKIQDTLLEVFLADLVCLMLMAVGAGISSEGFNMAGLAGNDIH